MESQTISRATVDLVVVVTAEVNQICFIFKFRTKVLPYYLLKKSATNATVLDTSQKTAKRMLKDVTNVIKVDI